MRHPLKIQLLPVLAFFIGNLALPAAATTYYVDINSTDPTPPYTNWNTAATDIQDAVDAANPGDTVLVTNGIYQTGGRPVVTSDYGPTVSNRVVVTNSILLQSVNGPAVTMIVGNQVPGTINDYGAVRCAYLDNGAILSGFTITNGATGPAGSDGLWESWGGGINSPSGNSIVTNCIIINNASGDNGGGAAEGTYNNCQFVGNQSGYGGGAENSILNNCTLTGNSALYGGLGGGGGADYSTLNNCILANNLSDYAGGANLSTLNNCALYGNSSGGGGGGAGGGSTLNTCTLTGNSAGGSGGGADSSTLNNCIVYFNSGFGETNCSNCTLNFSCTTPLPDNNVNSNTGTNNIATAPQMADDFHIAAGSPCIGAGSTNYSSGVDIDGQPWLVPPSIGCDEFYPGATGALAVAVSEDYPQTVPGFALTFTGQITGHAGGNIWDFGDGTITSNQVFVVQHSWAAPGDYQIIFTAFNDDNPGGVSATTMVHVAAQLIYYVDANGTNPVSPFNSWATAATNIQDAIDAATPSPESLVLVTNGVYATGGRTVNGYALTNRVVVGKPVTVQSVNGPAATVIVGYQVPGTTNDDSAIRCIYLAGNATLSGFSLTQGATRGSNGNSPNERYGGGIFCDGTNCIITNCVISGNAADGGGGGAYGGTFLNCTVANNSANGSGGGVSSASLNGCIISSNFTIVDGGGADSCTATNCSFVDNLAFNSQWFNGGAGGGAHSCTLFNCFFTGNSAIGGGGARDSMLSQCLVSNNFAAGPGAGGAGIEESVAANCIIVNNHSFGVGGGVDYSALTNCLIIGNHADDDGGGYWGGIGPYYTLNNCLVISNSAGGQGGGINDGTLYNCTVVGNTASEGGGVFDSSIYNSIVYDNDAGYQPNHANYCYFDHSCTVPMPIPNEDGPGNFATDPQLADVYHLSASSPCRNTGNPAYAVGVDFDGLPWASPPSVGCDEFYAAAVTGPLTVAMQPDYTNVATGFTVTFAIQTTGHAGSNLWNFGDGTSATNQPFAAHAWAAPGTYTVTFTVYNGSNPGGVNSTVTIQVVAPPVHYVSLTSANPMAPFTSWDTAATNIQDAVDASEIPGAVILVSNGVYNTGGQIMYGILSNRVAVTKPVTLQSVNGAAVTVIQGNPVIGSNAVRCLWMTNGSALRGFTITQGATRDGNGSEPREISAGGLWSQSLSVKVFDCTFISNSAFWDGGGMVGGTVSNCTFIGNSGGDAGGAAAGGIYSHCQFLDNSCIEAGGVWDGVVNNSYFISNSATVPYSDFGGATYEGVLNNCALNGNVGDAAAYSLLNNCTLVANVRGGAEASTLNNCIAFYNIAGNGAVYNYSSDSVLNYCCSVPLATTGVGNIATDPQLADAAHLTADSPCRGAASPAFVSGVDIDDQPWLNPPSIGCDEYYPGAVGSLAVAIQAPFTNFAVGYTASFEGLIIGHAAANQWNFGDGTAVSNLLAVTHTWTMPGNYPVTLTAYNDDNPGGISATVMVQVVQGDYYVAQNNLNPVAPYASWDTAATNIEDAVNVAAAGGTIWVSNGVYQAGGDLGGGNSNRVSATFPLVIQSINGPAQTVIDGMAAMRGVYLTNGASLSGFTITNGNGGGVAGESTLSVVSNCLITANAGSGASQCAIYNSILTGNISGGNGAGAFRCLLNQCFIANNVVNGQYGEGGGVFEGTLNQCVVSNNATTGSVSGGAGVEESTLNNCLVVGNFSSGWGGGVDLSTLNNCTVVGNSATGQYWSWGGGVANSAVNNCIVYYNNAPNAPNIGYSSPANYTCAPDSVSGPGNFTNAPVFLNAGGDYHLQTNSPCINSGNNAYVFGTNDLDGNIRIVGGTVDVGAYEYQTPTSVISYAYLQQYGLPTDGSVDYSDLDGTGFNVYQDWIAGLNPTNSASVLAMLPPTATNNAAGITVTWQSVPNILYNLQRSTDLSEPFSTIQSNIVGQAGTTSYTDSSATNNLPYFYRVGVP